MVRLERLRQMKAALVDFLLRAHEVPHLEKILLFGSLLEGDVNKKSDIDLLLIFNSQENPETGVELREATRLGIEVLKNYSIENNFSFVACNLKEPSKIDKDFLTETAVKGIIIWEKGGYNFLKKHQEIEAKTLFTYSTKGLPPAKKRKLLRRVSLLGQLFGKRLGKGVILLDKKQASKAEEIFREVKAFYQKQEVFS